MSAAAPPRILVAGIGNIFLGDDAFGVEVAQRLMSRALPEGVRVLDFGIRGFDLASALLEGYEAAVLVDATPRGGAPGTLYVIEPNLPDAPADETAPLDGHRLEPERVLRLAHALGGSLPRILLVGCEPVPLPEEEMTMEMSGPVRAAVEEAARLVVEEVVPLLNALPRRRS